MTQLSPLQHNLHPSISIVKKKKRAAQSKGSAQIASGLVPLNLLCKSQSDRDRARTATPPPQTIHGIISQSRVARRPLDTELLLSSLSQKSPTDRDFFAKVPSTHFRKTQDSTVKSMGVHKIMPVPEHEPLASRVLEFSLAEAGWYETFATTENQGLRLQDYMPYTSLLDFTRIECRDTYYLSMENARPQVRASACERYLYFGIGSRVILIPGLNVNDSLDRVLFSKTRVLIILLSREDYYLITHESRDMKMRAFFSRHAKRGLKKWITLFQMEEDALSGIVRDCRRNLVDRNSTSRLSKVPADTLPEQVILVDDADTELNKLSSSNCRDDIEEVIDPGTPGIIENPLYRCLHALKKDTDNQLLPSPALTKVSLRDNAPEAQDNDNRPLFPSSPVPHDTSESSPRFTSLETKENVKDSSVLDSPEPKSAPAASFADQINLCLKPQFRPAPPPSSSFSASSPAPKPEESKEISSWVSPSPILSFESVSPPPRAAPKSPPIRQNSPVFSTAESPITIELGLQIPTSFNPDLKHRFANNNSFTITYNDFRTLYNNEWINDSLIDFFIEYEIEAAVASTPDLERNMVYAFNSFFFTKLVSNSAYQDLPDYYANVKRWLLKVDLMKYDLVVIPINENAHWYACVIKGLPQLLERAIAQKAMESAIEVSDSERKEGLNGNPTSERSIVTAPGNSVNDPEIIPTLENDTSVNTGPRPGKAKRMGQTAEIYVFDSLCQKHTAIKDPIKSFLVDYCQEKYNVDVSTTQFRFINARVPKQNNFNDCGVHVIYNIRKWLRDMAECEAAWRMLYPKNSAPIRRIFPADERGTMRSQLIDILLRLHEKQSMGGSINPPRSREDNDDDDDDDIEVIGVSKVEGHVSLDDACLPLSYTRNQTKEKSLVKSRSMLELATEKANGLKPVSSAGDSKSESSTRTLDPRAAEQVLLSKSISPISVQSQKPLKTNILSEESTTSPPRRRSPVPRSRLSPSMPLLLILNESISARLASDGTQINPILVKQLNMWFRNKTLVHLEATLDEISKLYSNSIKLNESELVTLCSEFPKRYRESRRRGGDANRPRDQKLVITDSEPLGYGDDWGLIQPRDQGHGSDSASHSNGEHSSEEEIHALSDDGETPAAQGLKSSYDVPKRRRIQATGFSSP